MEGRIQSPCLGSTSSPNSNLILEGAHEESLGIHVSTTKAVLLAFVTCVF